MELPEEQNKLKEIAAGNVEAFEHLFFQYQPRLVNFLIGLTHDKEVSRDMAQDLFLSLWKDREKLKNVRSPPTFSRWRVLPCMTTSIVL